MDPFLPVFLASAVIFGGIWFFFVRDARAERAGQRLSLLEVLGLYIISPVLATVLGALSGMFIPVGMWDFSAIAGGGLGGLVGVIGAAVIAAIIRANAYA